MTGQRKRPPAGTGGRGDGNLERQGDQNTPPRFESQKIVPTRETIGAYRARFTAALILRASADGLDLSAVRVGWLLADFFNVERGFAWPSQEMIAERLEITARSVRRAVLRLRDKGWFKVDTGGGRTPGGNGLSNAYIPVWAKILPPPGGEGPKILDASHDSKSGDLETRTSLSGFSEGVPSSEDTRTRMVANPDEFVQNTRTKSSHHPSYSSLAASTLSTPWGRADARPAMAEQRRFALSALHNGTRGHGEGVSKSLMQRVMGMINSGSIRLTGDKEVDLDLIYQAGLMP